jgi:YidC/Oxa1 family membrane protein insertase
LAGAQGAAFPTHKTVMKLVSGAASLKEGDTSLVIKFESPELGGIKLVKTYTVERGSM